VALKLFGRRLQGENLEKRTYFEVYGDYLDMYQSLRRISMGLLAVNVLLLLLLNHSLRKPPLIIRVSDVGEATPIKDLSESSRITKPEVLNFVKLFMKFFLERNHYTWKDNLVEAGLMMTADYRNRANKEIDFDKEIASLEANKLTSKLKFSDIEITRETPDALLVSLKGWRQITSYDDPAYLKETVFAAELGLKKVPRSEATPYGLLVDSYKQRDFKDE
jgi:hypothetical protein